MSGAPAGKQGLAKAAALERRVHDLGALVLDRRVRGREARDGHAERAAGHVVESGLVEELHRGGLAAVLAADADLELGLLVASLLDRDFDEGADAVPVEDLERVV